MENIRFVLYEDDLVAFFSHNLVRENAVLNGDESSADADSWLQHVTVLYEDDLVAFFSHNLVRENAVSCVQGKFVEISEERFACVFALPTARLNSRDEVPKDLIYDAQSVFSESGEPIKTSCKNKEMKIEFHLLNDILSKSVTVKAGSFDAVTHERFLLMTAIHCGLKINWSKIVFHILKDMGALDQTLGDAKTFHPLKILTVKTFGTYVSKNKSIIAEEVTDEPPVENVVKKAAGKRRPTPAAEPVAKRKHTTVRRSAPIEKNLPIVPVVQNPKHIILLSYSLLAMPCCFDMRVPGCCARGRAGSSRVPLRPRGNSHVPHLPAGFVSCYERSW
ncbi:myosin-11-like [Dorcoceras hygrometricum]|uniref:Myosin-11-like n=1 Tax=Dorcoceras hygrometricum TaxID=472368 RepID=A0A2Z7ATG2_9LAMI|nr:myosin-11-like [Dorcoceras hygrometricum]